MLACLPSLILALMKFWPLVLCGIALEAADLSAQTLVEHQHRHPSGDAPCSFDRSVFDKSLDCLPIGVFDSGIGGLTVLESILTLDVFDNKNLQPRSDGRRDFAAERFVYFGDQANMPYGNYPAADRADLLRELIVRDAVFLLGKQYYQPGNTTPVADKPPVKAIVIACNTATAFGMEDIRSALKAWNISIPVVGVVEAGARGVMEALPRNGTPDAIAVLATVGTCSCEAYPKAIARAVGLAGKPLPLIVQQGCVGLAGAIEGDPAFVSPSTQRSAPYQGPIPDPALTDLYQFDPTGMLEGHINSVANHVRYEVKTLVDRHQRSGASTPIGMVVLGCTHYPLVTKEIAAAFHEILHHKDSTGRQLYLNLVRETLTFINPAEFTARELFRELARARIRNAEDGIRTDKDQFYLSVPNPTWPGIKLTPTGALEPAYRHQRPLGDFQRLDTLPVILRPSMLPSTAVRTIQRLMPAVWERLQ